MEVDGPHCNSALHSANHAPQEFRDESVPIRPPKQYEASESSGFQFGRQINSDHGQDMTNTLPCPHPATPPLGLSAVIPTPLESQYPEPRNDLLSNLRDMFELDNPKGDLRPEPSSCYREAGPPESDHRRGLFEPEDPTCSPYVPNLVYQIDLLHQANLKSTGNSAQVSSGVSGLRQKYKTPSSAHNSVDLYSNSSFVADMYAETPSTDTGVSAPPGPFSFDEGYSSRRTSPLYQIKSPVSSYLHRKSMSLSSGCTCACTDEDDDSGEGEETLVKLTAIYILIHYFLLHEYHLKSLSASTSPLSRSFSGSESDSRIEQCSNLEDQTENGENYSDYTGESRVANIESNKGQESGRNIQGRKRDSQEDGGKENEDDRRPNKRRIRPTDDLNSLGYHLACPFAKGIPSKYPACALIGRQDLAGVK
ncbi:hypothetical protein TWF718_010926 [Orbilia javanica]|uniref:Uncharacterized protein n=1 Tax=Orbilia javanica TaxID=47235 RepID=A0AAN8RC31_9PEZI